MVSYLWLRAIMTIQNNAKNVTRLLSQIRALSHHYLPISHSFIPYDILLTLVDRRLQDEPTSIKSLFASLKHSESGTRYHFERLLKLGWIQLKPHDTDSRVKLCEINPAFEPRVDAFLASVNRITEQARNNTPSHTQDPTIPDAGEASRPSP